MKAHAVEFYLRHLSRAVAFDSIWEIAGDELRGIEIRWPDKYEWGEASDWVEVLKYSFRNLVDLTYVDNIPQPFKGTVIFQIVLDNKVKLVAINYSDYLPIEDGCAKTCDLCFKMQYDRNGYPFDNIVPGGYVPDGKRLYLHLRNLRNLRKRKSYLYDVYGRFSLNYAPELRGKAVTILSNQDAFHFEGGPKTVSYIDFLKEVSRSKICIDLPGLGSLCFRLMNYLAIGSCVIAYPHQSLLHVPLVDRRHIVFCKEDLSDLTELCEYYLRNDDEREMIAENARNFFDLYLHKDNLAKYYLRSCLDRLR